MPGTEWKQLKKYAGQWVAVHGNKIVGHGNTLKEAYVQALKLCKNPKVFQVVENTHEVYLL